MDEPMRQSGSAVGVIETGDVFDAFEEENNDEQDFKCDTCGQESWSRCIFDTHVIKGREYLFCVQCISDDHDVRFISHLNN